MALISEHKTRNVSSKQNNKRIEKIVFELFSDLRTIPAGNRAMRLSLALFDDGITHRCCSTEQDSANFLNKSIKLSHVLTTDDDEKKFDAFKIDE